MAIQYVGGTSGSDVGRTDSTFSTVVSLTSLTGGIASSPSEGDVIVVVVGTGSSAERTISVGQGYSNIARLYSLDTYKTNFSFDYKVMGSSPDTSFKIPTSGSGSDAITCAIHVWRGIDTLEVLDVTHLTATGTNSSLPNPPAITPISTGAIVICAGAAAGTNLSSGGFTSPDLSNFISTFKTDTYHSACGIGSYEWTSGQFDAGAWSGHSSDSTNSWASATIALKPISEQETNTSNFFQFF